MGWNPFKAAKKFVKKAVSGVTGIVKKVAKRIKKVASSVWRGVKQVAGKVMGVFGKLGPIGTIALSFMLPGIGSALGAMWTSASTALAGGAWGTFGTALGQGMQWAAKAVMTAKDFIGTGFSTITDKISGTLSQVGGTIMDGAKNMWTSAKEFMGFKGDPLKLGQMVGQSAQKGMVSSAIQANPELIKMANSSGISVTDLARKQAVSLQTGQNAFGSILGAEQKPFTIQDNPEFLKMASKKAGTDTAQQIAAKQQAFLSRTGGNALQNNPEFLRMAGGDVNKANELLLSQEADLGRRSAAFTGTKNALTADIQTPQDLAKSKKPSLMDKVLQGASNFFDEQPAAQAAVPFFAGTTPDAERFGANRAGVGGRGSAGGQFINPAILELIKQQNKRIEELG